MASVSLTRSYLHVASDLPDHVRFTESGSYATRGTRSEVESHSDATRKVVSSPADEQSNTIELPIVHRDVVTDLRRLVDQVVLFRSPTGEYVYAQVLSVRSRRRGRLADHLVAGVTVRIEPVDYPGLI